MNVKTVVKVILAAFVLLAALPLLMQLRPTPLTAERVRAGFEQAGFTVFEFVKLPTPGLDAVEQVSITVSTGSGTPVTAALYRFDNTGKLAKQYEYNKPDMGAGAAEAFNLSNIAAGVTRPQPQRPVNVGKNRMFLLVATGDTKEQVNRVIKVFEGL
ncbi:MAG TPA: hypothetical protein PKI11_14040 [Candidatus Hydrogenedentes bacterium]|nr:hypothetical protein [Candidatus Hydrogenedentota bacterium]